MSDDEILKAAQDKRKKCVVYTRCMGERSPQKDDNCLSSAGEASERTYRHDVSEGHNANAKSYKTSRFCSRNHYCRPVESFNLGKKGEHRERIKFKEKQNDERF